MTSRLDVRTLSAYLESVLPPRHKVLQEMEARARANGFPIVGPAVGHLLYVLTRLGGARRVFELGSGFGYSTAWLAMGVRDNGGGEVTHVVWDKALSNDARAYLRRLGLDELVRYRVGEAIAELRRARGRFDIIFNDIEKDGYPASFPVIKARLASGGLLIVDNMVWSGRILDTAANDAEVRGIRKLTRIVFSDAQFSAVIVPLRDGVLLARKR
ncbi:MAG TPA: O-methyltransferase [bacterium]|nr:O-methyltransferase [bacterium]